MMPIILCVRSKTAIKRGNLPKQSKTALYDVWFENVYIWQLYFLIKNFFFNTSSLNQTILSHLSHSVTIFIFPPFRANQPTSTSDSSPKLESSPSPPHCPSSKPSSKSYSEHRPPTQPQIERVYVRVEARVSLGRYIDCVCVRRLPGLRPPKRPPCAPVVSAVCILRTQTLTTTSTWKAGPVRSNAPRQTRLTPYETYPSTPRWCWWWFRCWGLGIGTWVGWRSRSFDVEIEDLSFGSMKCLWWLRTCQTRWKFWSWMVQFD